MSQPPSTRQRLTRRRFLQGLGITSSAVVLTGCKTLPSMDGIGGHVRGMVSQATGRSRNTEANARQNGLKPWSPDDQQRADRAQYVIDHIKRHGTMPWIASESAFPDRLEEVEQVRSRIMRHAKAAGDLPLNPHITYAMQTTPVAVQGVLQEAGNIPKGRRPEVKNGMIAVPPGTRVRARFKGACLDDELPAPSRGESLTVRHSNEYIHPDLQGVYQGVNRLRGQGAMSYADYQQIIWAIRNVGADENAYLDNLNARQHRLLERAAPRGASQLVSTHTRESHDLLGDASKALMGELSKRFQININGESLSAGQLFQQGGPEQAVSTLLEGVLSREAPGAVPKRDESSFTVLADTVAIEAHAADRLDPEITMTNAGNDTFYFNPSEYVLESRRETQRVSIPQAGPGSEFDVPFDIIPIVPNEGVNALTQRFLDDLYLFTVDTTLRSARDWAATAGRIRTRVGALWAPVMDRISLAGEAFRHLASSAAGRRAARATLDTMPLIGNAFSLFEAIAGYHILERDNPSSMPERGLALIGVIPGANAARSLARNVMTSRHARKFAKDLTRKTAIMLKRYSQSGVVKGFDRTDTMQDVAWWTLSDAHELLASGVDADLDTEYTRPWNDVIGYVKSL